MPGGDRTGPNGMGPMTGRAAGYCTGNNMPGFANRVFGRGIGGGARGGGRGWRNMYHATGLTGWQRGYGRFPLTAAYGPLSREDEMASLKNEAEYMENTLKNIKKRISELENQPEK